MEIKTTLSLAASANASAYAATDGFSRAKIKVEVADTTDAVGTFYVISRATDDDQWARHPVLNQAKTAGNGLRATFDWPVLCGRHVSVEWVRTAGGAAQTASIYMHLG